MTFKSATVSVSSCRTTADCSRLLVWHRKINGINSSLEQYKVEFYAFVAVR